MPPQEEIGPNSDADTGAAAHAGPPQILREVYVRVT
jgi:hypothetical protein